MSNIKENPNDLIANLNVDYFTFKGELHLARVVKTNNKDMIDCIFMHNNKYSKFRVKLFYPKRNHQNAIGLNGLLLDKNVYLYCKGYDDYGRILGVVKLNLDDEKSINDIVFYSTDQGEQQTVTIDIPQIGPNQVAQTVPVIQPVQVTQTDQSNEKQTRRRKKNNIMPINQTDSEMANVDPTNLNTKEVYTNSFSSIAKTLAATVGPNGEKLIVKKEPEKPAEKVNPNNQTNQNNHDNRPKQYNQNNYNKSNGHNQLNNQFNRNKTINYKKKEPTMNELEVNAILDYVDGKTHKLKRPQNQNNLNASSNIQARPKNIGGMQRAVAINNMINNINNQQPKPDDKPKSSVHDTIPTKNIMLNQNRPDKKRKENGVKI